MLLALQEFTGLRRVYQKKEALIEFDGLCPEICIPFEYNGNFA